MNERRSGGLSLLIGTGLGLLTMATHPTGQDIQRDPSFQGALNAFAHGIAVVAVPLVLFGFASLTRWMRTRSSLADLAFWFMVTASIATIIAATISGFVTPKLLLDATHSRSDDVAAARHVIHLAAGMNRAFAQILVVLTCGAISLWSLAGLRTRTLRRGTSVYGVIASIAFAGAVMGGHLPMSIHGFGAFVVAQSVFNVLVGLELRASRVDDVESTPPRV